jgi:type III restriction enzyme
MSCILSAALSQFGCTLDKEVRRTKENQRIGCGREHFDALGIDYDVETSLAEVPI